MQLRIHGKNMQVTDWMESYVEKKLGKLDRYLPNIDETRVELSVESTRNAGDGQICQVTVHTKGRILRAEERSSDMRDAIDSVVDKMYRQIARYKGKRWNRGRGAQPAESFGEELPLEFEEEDEDAAGQIVRRKQFTALPMDEREAVEQMVLLGHDFFLFFNVDTAQINVVYRRKDGNFGLPSTEPGLIAGWPADCTRYLSGRQTRDGLSPFNLRLCSRILGLSEQWSVQGSMLNKTSDSILIDLLIMLGDVGPTLPEQILGNVREAVALDIIEKGLALEEIDRVIVGTNRRSFLHILSRLPVDVILDYPDETFHFGRQIQTVIQEFDIDKVFYMGGGGRPLALRGGPALPGSGPGRSAQSVGDQQSLFVRHGGVLGRLAG